MNVCDKMNGEPCPRCKQPVFEGHKCDAGKPRFDLLPTEPLFGVCQVLTYGAVKYADRNWEVGMDWGRVFGASQRHQWAFWGGEELDPESGLHHLDHAITSLMFLRTYVARKIGKDTRPKPGGTLMSALEDSLVDVLPQVDDHRAFDQGPGFYGLSKIS